MKVYVDLSAEQRAFSEGVRKQFDELLKEAETNPQALMMMEGMLLMLKASFPVPILDEFQIGRAHV